MLRSSEAVKVARGDAVGKPVGHPSPGAPRVGSLIGVSADVYLRDVDAIVRGSGEAGCTVVALVDPMTSQIGPDQFRQFVTPVVAPVGSP